MVPGRQWLQARRLGYLQVPWDDQIPEVSLRQAKAVSPLSVYSRRRLLTRNFRHHTENQRILRSVWSPGNLSTRSRPWYAPRGVLLQINVLAEVSRGSTMDPPALLVRNDEARVVRSGG